MEKWLQDNKMAKLGFANFHSENENTHTQFWLQNIQQEIIVFRAQTSRILIFIAGAR